MSDSGGGGSTEAGAALPEAAAAVDVALFRQVIEVPALRVPARRVGELQRSGECKALFFRRRGVRNVLPDPATGGAGDAAGGVAATASDGATAAVGEAGRGEVFRLVLLQPGVTLETLPAPARSLVDAGGASFVMHRLELGYEETTAEEALQRILPQGVEAPRGFETVGHLAHFNLREAQWPFRKAIGQVVLDKNPCIKTVVTKVGSLSNEFRTFDMEVIAGRDDTDVTVAERGLKLRFDFRSVYWNSRLSEERVRLLAKVSPSDIVLDLFAGVGAFALLCARQDCRVVANDLNPAGAEAIRRNAQLNHVQLEVHNLCARECVRLLARAPPLERRTPPRVHVVMNLPELALDFLDAFREMVVSGTSALWSGSAIELHVHCYCFAREKESPEKEVHPRLLAALGCVPADTHIREVRDVAPKKNMYCVEFAVPLAGAAASPAAAAGLGSEPPDSGGDAEAGGGEAKRQKKQ